MTDNKRKNRFIEELDDDTPMEMSVMGDDGRFYNTIRELIYSGKSGTTVEVAYREFRGGYAAPAFSQNLKYDLQGSAVISFQEFRIKVLEATNNAITYQVVSDLGNKD